MRADYSEIHKRAERKYREKKKLERQQANGFMPNAPAKQHPFIAKSAALKKAIQLPNGAIVDAQDASDDDFYLWFQHITEKIVEAVRAQGKHVIVLRRVQQEFRRHKYELDDEARWFFILEVYRLSVYQQSGMSMFVNEQVLSRSKSA